MLTATTNPRRRRVTGRGTSGAIPPRMPNPTRLDRRSSAWPALALIAIGLTASACGSKRDGAPSETATAKAAPATATAAAKAPADGALGGACDRREREKICAEYRGAYAKPAWVEKECVTQQVPFLPGGCPADGAVGRCTRDRGTPSQTDTVFYAPMTRETVVAMCRDGIVSDR
jgi:hypothetical protein